MISRPDLSETAVIARGLVILALSIVIGVSAAEKQLNTLTLQQDCVQFCNIVREAGGVYSFYILGERYTAQAVYPVARISVVKEEYIIEAVGKRVVISEFADFNKEIARAGYFFDLWHRQFIDEAYKFKYVIEAYSKEIRQKINFYISQLQ